MSSVPVLCDAVTMLRDALFLLFGESVLVL
jgi:hypothetical protein